MKTINYLICGLAVMAFSCKKPTPVPPPAPDETATKLFFQENVGEATQEFTVDAGSDINITGEKGTVLFIPANSFVDGAGDPVTGNIEIELIEINQKSEMILMNKATNGISSGSANAPLVSGGELYVKASQYGVEIIATAPMSVNMPAETYEPRMRKFVNTTADEDEDLLWEIAEDSIITFSDSSEFLMMDFEILPDDWGWVNCDFFSNVPGPRTTITCTVPEGFTHENTGIFLSIDGEKSVVGFNDYLEIPVGTDLHFIGIGVVGDELHYTIQSATITDGHNQHVDDFSAIGEDALTSLIDALP